MDEASILLELQEHDLRTMRLNKQLDEMPEKRAILQARAKIHEIETLLARTDGAGRALDARAKKLEDEIGTIKAKMEAEQGKLLSGSVKNPKELAAISLELDALKRRSEVLENEELAEMAKRETATEQSARVSTALEQWRAKETELVGVFKEHGGGIVSEIEKLAAEREKLVAALPEDLRRRYEAVRESKHGIAVGVLEGDTCGVCRVGVPAGHLERLLAGPSVGVCPMCNRLLVIRKP